MPTVCAAGFWCNSGNKCAALPTVSESCVDSLACTGGYCDQAGDKTCKTYLNTGDSCSYDYQCASGLESDDNKCAAPGEFYCGGA